MGNNQPRSFKFYRENEKQVMESLGLKPTKNSGSTWIEKEDGQNDLVKPIELANISQYIKTGHCVIETEQFVSCDKDDKENENERKKIENDLESRMQYFEECRKKYDKTKTAK